MGLVAFLGLVRTALGSFQMVLAFLSFRGMRENFLTFSVKRSVLFCCLVAQESNFLTFFFSKKKIFFWNLVPFNLTPTWFDTPIASYYYASKITKGDLRRNWVDLFYEALVRYWRKMPDEWRSVIVPICMEKEICKVASIVMRLNLYHTFYLWKRVMEQNMISKNHLVSC